jgi:hypothetical protein
MLQVIGRFLRLLFGYRSIQIIEDTTTKISFRFGPTVTVFDKDLSQVLQNGKLVAMMPLITEIQVYQPTSQASTPAWFVSTRVSGARSVEIGQATEKEEAAHIAGLISAFVKKPVKIQR